MTSPPPIVIHVYDRPSRSIVRLAERQRWSVGDDIVALVVDARGRRWGYWVPRLGRRLTTLAVARRAIEGA